MKTSELQGAALDWAVAKAIGVKVYPSKSGRWMTADYGEFNHRHGAPWFCPSESWAQGGPIIQREKIGLHCGDNTWGVEEGIWEASHPECLYIERGVTPLIAAMRCYVASKMGNEVELPEELK